MKALITGATSGIGREFAIELSEEGYDLILIARSKLELNRLKNSLNTNSDILSIDLSNVENCYKVYKKYKDEDIDLFVNNAGVGVFGKFIESSLEDEVNMINLNLITPHILTKLFLKEFIKKDKGHILNIASTAAFSPGPLMAVYYSTKSYIYSFTCAIYEELKRDGSNVKISVLCPGPVETNFNKSLGIKFSTKALSSKYVVLYSLKQLKKDKLVIIPGFTNRILKFLIKFLPLKLLLKINFKIQNKKVIK